MIKKRIWIYLFTAIIILGIISWYSTAFLWDGSYPSGWFVLEIRNNYGDLIEGAEVKIINKDNNANAYGYPFNNYDNNKLVSDSRGIVELLHKPQGLEFGSISWKLFWIIPFKGSPEPYQVIIQADGYRTKKFNANRLFKFAERKVGIGGTRPVELTYYVKGTPQPEPIIVEVEIYRIPITLHRRIITR